MVTDVRDDGDLMKEVWTEVNQLGDCQNEDGKAMKGDMQVFDLGNCW